MLNGDGLRVVLWVSGCEHMCKGCQNQETWDSNSGIVYDAAAEEEIFSYLARDYIDGLTLSGGDPLHPSDIGELYRLVKRAKETYPEKTVWLYTGCHWNEVKGLPLMRYVDVVVDGPFVETLADVNYHWAGSTNQRVIDVPQSLKRHETVLWRAKP